ncbi:hypothetical protein N7447_004831 [Penicillium robsamsonii]|uniref:uncharacterized protein n=1 Tax=Penicillium robsamsonii TaxID=1792511 RepID=UPI0025489C28|nr:uncharacterized protein N7447_004831 [Penicillium robsamsonii]KAJ5822491.1 hypothetical protein N7447_004831 [Penicillium robsamsonii]
MFCQYRPFKLCTRMEGEKHGEERVCRENMQGKNGILWARFAKMKCQLAMHTQNCPPAETLAIPTNKRGRDHP